MAFFSAASPPPFLPTPGQPAIPWEQWKGVFLNFLGAAGGDELQPNCRKAILLNALGVEGQRVFYSIAGARTVLDAHFATTTSVLVDRHRLRQRRQAPNEAFEAYAASLRELASSCDYGDGVDNVIRDQLLEGTTSRQIRERLLYEGSTLTLQRALDIGRHIEQIQREIHEFDGDASVQRVAPKKTEKPSSAKGCCYRCGSPTHKANCEKCPAKNKRCRRCKKIGHFEAVCKSSEMFSVQAVKDPKSAEANVVTVLHIGDDYTRAREISTEVLIGNVPIRFFVDTGATVSLLSEEDYRKNFAERYPLSATSVVLQNYTKEEIPSVGCFLAEVTYRNKDACVMFYVTKRGISLLGLDANRNLRINIEGETLSCFQAATSPASTLLPPSLREDLLQAKQVLPSSFRDASV
ncbi:uncharacterized protein LOC121836625 [Ixodes scapularis]|uniref:uncharacterized protein LOC121836625 n=1 Tax=Ixodes scapularis TaxID=6945 RepID=UPI001C387A92|nr:uncharacterized protein LOC121836625 [Ixodes scapularis]